MNTSQYLPAKVHTLCNIVLLKYKKNCPESYRIICNSLHLLEENAILQASRYIFENATNFKLLHTCSNDSNGKY